MEYPKLYLCGLYLSIFAVYSVYTTVIQALWEAKVRGSPEVRSSRLAWPTRQDPISNKNFKLPRCGGTCL